jgi:hypothetical protein
MPFFKRILKQPEAVVEVKAAAPAVEQPERRRAVRYTIGPKFPLKAVLSFIGRDETGTRLSSSRAGWDWKGRLIDFSEQGARMLLGPAALAASGDVCELHLSLESFDLVVPCHITNIREQAEGRYYGLKHDITDAATQITYLQLLEIVALGARLKLHGKKSEPDATGYLLEQYASDRQSRLSIWRYPEGKEVAAFEFLLRDCVVRAAAGQDIEYLSGADAATARRVSGAQMTEIYRLFQWVVPNLPPAVPADVRELLLRCTG